jgi:hypothetical protein
MFFKVRTAIGPHKPNQIGRRTVKGNSTACDRGSQTMNNTIRQTPNAAVADISSRLGNSG